MRLTDEQRAVLAAISGGEVLIVRFDRDALGWTLEPSGEAVPFSMVEGLMRRRALSFGDPRRLGLGRFEAKYAITDLGRAGALS
ncbi:MAG: hypothetical protein LCH86_09750 [Proteobacteria bacterium]|nr:hypothetical protein [Pseudomonadota bacterium]